MTNARVLIASDIVADAELVRRLLQNEFGNVFISTSPDKAISDFEHCMPNVLILAFNSLEKAELYYLGLYRLSTKVISVAHRTIMLCGAKELPRVYELCRKEYFNDYVLFWPMTNDVQRLPLAITHALRDLERSQSDAPAAEMARQVRRIAELEGLLERQLDQGDHYAKTANRSLKRAEAEIDAAIDSFSKNVIDGSFGDAQGITNAVRMQQEINKLRANEIQQRFRTLNDAVQPMGQWVGELKQQLAPHRESMSALKILADHFHPLILVVDDEEFERKLAGELLSAAPYDLLFASNGAEALNLMSERRPDLILMDMVMPEINGLETLRRLKASHRFADIPVMMITGQSEKDVVVECLKAGAVDFVVKPLDRKVLLKKVERFLTG
jgi:CheY-like chemotaxis protein